jgi:hypothetical protein
VDHPELPESPFTRHEAENEGITRWQLDMLLDTRAVRRLLSGVYADATIPDSIELRCRAAGLVISPNAVLCDRTAAWLHGIDVLRYRELEVLPPLEVFVLRGLQRVDRPECMGGERDLSPRDLMVIDGVLVTTPLRTALDLGCRLNRYDAIAALDAFMRKFGLTHAQMGRELRRYRRRRGVVQLRQLVPLADPRAESPRESWTRLAIADSNLPLPELQFWVKEHGVPIFRLDHAYPKSRIAVEYDGEDFHDSSEEQREADRARRTWLRDRGWTVIVVTKEGFTDGGRQAWLNELRLALRLAA